METMLELGRHSNPKNLILREILLFLKVCFDFSKTGLHILLMNGHNVGTGQTFKSKKLNIKGNIAFFQSLLTFCLLTQNIQSTFVEELDYITYEWAQC